MNAISKIPSKRQVEMSWKVIDMARRDGSGSLYPDGIIARLSRSIFGLAVPRGLANPGLEALRRFAVRAWHWDFVPEREFQAFLDAGYSATDAKRILAYVAHHRGFTPSLLASPA